MPACVIPIHVAGHDPQRRVGHRAGARGRLHAARDGTVAISFEEVQIRAGSTVGEDVGRAVTVGVTEGEARRLAVEGVGVGHRGRERRLALVDEDRQPRGGRTGHHDVGEPVAVHVTAGDGRLHAARTHDRAERGRAKAASPVAQQHADLVRDHADRGDVDTPVLVEVPRAEVERARSTGGKARRRTEGPGRALALVAIDADVAVAHLQVGLTVDGDRIEPAVAVHVRERDLLRGACAHTCIQMVPRRRSGTFG